MTRTIGSRLAMVLLIAVCLFATMGCTPSVSATPSPSPATPTAPLQAAASPTAKPAPSITVSQVSINPPESVQPSTSITLMVTVAGDVDAQATINYEWTDRDGKGQIDLGDQGKSAIRYTTPAVPGPYLVDVKVKVTVGNNPPITTTRTASITVVSSITPTPTVTLTPTPKSPIPIASSSPVTPIPQPTTPVPAAVTPASSLVTLTTLKQGDTVPCDYWAEGTYQAGLQGTIWPVVFVTGNYHPQDDGGSPPTMKEGKWAGPVRFGDCNNPNATRGQTFQLLIVTANEAANKAFLDYLNTAAKTGLYSGTPRLPDGVTEILRITVTRQ